VLTGGETVLGFKVAYTPGHASHHVCYLHEASGWAFVGDMAGVRIPPWDLTLAPTPPPDIDVDAWERSLDTIAAWEPAGLALTHFGTADDVPAQLAAVRESLRWQADLAAEQDQDGFMAALHERISRAAPEDVAEFEQAAPLDHLFLGLHRWHSKQG
jgi:glyoxylase-like metal-dependent hydrolase (beta-lactamase superfamily II)